jgi:pyruvate,water dikinase
MRRALTPLGVRIPDGLATTADAYRAFLAAAGLEQVIEESEEQSCAGLVGPALRLARLAGPRPQGRLGGAGGGGSIGTPA